jgi:hypothetical protein
MFGVRRARKAVDVSDPEHFFYVREWGCAPSTSLDAASQALGLVAGAEVSFADGIGAVEDEAQRTFVVEHSGAVFVFARGVGFSDFHERLSRGSSKTAYVIFLDDKRINISCSRAVNGATVRQIGCADGDAFDEGARAAGEPELDPESLGQEGVLALATAWGPDPKALVRAAPRGRLMSTATPRP